MEDIRYRKFFSLWAEGKFFEAHEILESLWRGTKGEEREFYHGLIQLAASLVHFQKGNLAGAQALFRTASQYLKPYLPNYRGVPLAKVLKDFQQFLEIVSKNPGQPSFAKEKLPCLNLSGY